MNFLENWQSYYQEVRIFQNQEASIFMEENTYKYNEMYLVSCGHPTDEILLLGYFNANRLSTIYKSSYIEVIQGTRNTPLKIRSTVYGNMTIYFMPLGIFRSKLQIETKNI